MSKYSEKGSGIKKRVLLGLPLPPPYSGAEKMADIILKSRITKEFDCIHIDASNKQRTNLERGCVNLANVTASTKISWEIFKLLSRKRVELANLPLNCTKIGYLKYFLMLFPCVISRTKVVSRLGASHFDKFYISQDPVFQSFIRWSLKHVDCIMVRGENQKTQLRGIYKGRVECVYVPSTGVRQDGRQRNYDLRSKKEINVLHVGHFSHAKGAYDLLRAIPHILATDQKYRFHFVGDIVMKERNILHLRNEKFDVKRFIKENNLGPFITLYGHLNYEDKERRFKDADLFVFPSYSEGSPFAVIEAMEFGLPVIATKVGNLPEIFENEKNVLYVDFNSPSQIKDAILKVMNKPELSHEMVLNNFKILQGLLSLERYEKRMIEIFQSVCEAN